MSPRHSEQVSQAAKKNLANSIENRDNKDMKQTLFFIPKKITLILVLFLALFGAQANEKDDQIIYAMLMNQIQYSLLTVQHYKSRAVLEKEYDNIICKIDKTRLVDSDCVEAYGNLLDTLTDLKLGENERQFLTIQAEKERKQAVNKILSGAPSAVGMAAVAFAGGNPAQAVTGLLFTGVSSVFNYRNTVNSIENSLNANLFRISQSDLRAIDSERNSLFKTYSRFITRYKIPKKYEIKEDQMKWLVEALDTLDANSKARLLETKKDIFALFTPFWFELGSAYQEIGNEKKARECYAEFEKQKKKYSIIDNDTYYTELAKNMILLLGDGEKVAGGAKKYIEIIEADQTVASENQNRMYLAELYYASGNIEKAEENLRLIMDDSREYLWAAHELYTLIEAGNTGKDKTRNDTISRALISAVEYEAAEEKSTQAQSLMDKVKNAANSVYSYFQSGPEDAALVLELPFSAENAPKILSIVCRGNTFTSEKRLEGGIAQFAFIDSASKIIPQSGEIAVEMYFEDGTQISAVYDCAFFGADETKAADTVLSVLENAGFLNTDLSALDARSFFEKSLALTKNSNFKKMTDTEKLKRAEEILEESRRVSLKAPFVYCRTLSRIGENTAIYYALKSITNGTKTYTFSKYGDALLAAAK